MQSFKVTKTNLQLFLSLISISTVMWLIKLFFIFQSKNPFLRYTQKWRGGVRERKRERLHRKDYYCINDQTKTMFTLYCKALCSITNCISDRAFVYSYNKYLITIFILNSSWDAALIWVICNNTILFNL